jgi:hypothetical protein
MKQDKAINICRENLVYTKLNDLATGLFQSIVTFSTSDLNSYGIEVRPLREAFQSVRIENSNELHFKFWHEEFRLVFKFALPTKCLDFITYHVGKNQNDQFLLTPLGTLSYQMDNNGVFRKFGSSRPFYSADFIAIYLEEVYDFYPTIPETVLTVLE